MKTRKMKYLLLLFCMGVSFHSGRCFSNEKRCKDGIKAVSAFGDGQWKNFLGEVLNGPCYPFFFYIDKKKVSQSVIFFSYKLDTIWINLYLQESTFSHVVPNCRLEKKSYFTDTDHLLSHKYELFHLGNREAVV